MNVSKITAFGSATHLESTNTIESNHTNVSHTVQDFLVGVLGPRDIEKQYAVQLVEL